MQSILAALDYPTVDYFSLDIEGAEYPVLKTFDDLSKTDIKMLDIEINHAGEIFQGTRKDIQQYLKSNGYNFTGSVKIDDFFVKTKSAASSAKKSKSIHWDLVGMDQNDPKLIEAIKDKILWPPPSNDLPLNLNGGISNNNNLGGQFGQPFYVEKILQNNSFWNPEKKGFYIEAGADNGEKFSNTLYFEIKYGWTGLLVEPNPYLWNELKGKNRNAWILPHCLSTTEKVEVMDFNLDAYVYSPDQKDHYGALINLNKQNSITPDDDRTLKVICTCSD